MSKAEDFVDKFEKASNVLAENAPEWLKYCVIIYARDTDVKTKDFPDWDIWFKIIDKTNHYDRQSIRWFMGEQF